MNVFKTKASFETLAELRYISSMAWVCAFIVAQWAIGARADDANYNANVFDGSSYVQHGPGPAYSSAYSDYGGNATGLEGRFSSEFGGVPGYARFGAGSAFGTGPLAGAGTGRSGEGSGFGTRKILGPNMRTPQSPSPANGQEPKKSKPANTANPLQKRN